MKRKILLISGEIVLTIAVMCGLAACASGTTITGIPTGQIITGNQQQGIWVSGEGKVTVTPDIASVSLGVSVQAATVADAQQQANNAMTKILAALTANGVDQKDIQTQNYSIQQLYSSVIYNTPAVPPSGAPNIPVITSPGQVLQYQVSNTVNVKIRSIDKTGNIIDVAAAAGGDLIRVNSVSFSVSQPDQYYTQARQLAVQNAADIAGQLAKTAGVTLGKATYISENSSTPIYPPQFLGAAAPAVSGTAINPGQTDIIVTVQIAYAVQ